MIRNNYSNEFKGNVDINNKDNRKFDIETHVSGCKGDRLVKERVKEQWEVRFFREFYKRKMFVNKRQWIKISQKDLYKVVAVLKIRVVVPIFVYRLWKLLCRSG